MREQARKLTNVLNRSVRSWQTKRSSFYPSCAVADDLLSDNDEVLSEDEDRQLQSAWSKLLDGITLGLPSELDPTARLAACPEVLIQAETRLRHAEAHEALDAVRSEVRTLGSIEHNRLIHSRGLDSGTRASRAKGLHRSRFYFHMDTYNRARECLLALGALTDPGMHSFYPVLTVADTFRRDPEGRREVGDSRLTDGQLWRPLAVPPIQAISSSGSKVSLTPSSTGTRRSNSE